MNTQIDVEKNIADLLEKLAQQIGTTVDKVFPWLITQAQIEGYIDLITNILFIISSIVVGWTLLNLYKKYNSNDYDDDFKSVVTATGSIFSGVIFIVSIMVFMINLSTYVGKITNSNYYALQYITSMIK